MRSNLHVGHISLDPIREKKLIVSSMPNVELLHDGSIVGNYSVKATGIDSTELAEIVNDDEFSCEFPIRILHSRHVVNLPHTTLRDTQTAFTRCFFKSLPERRFRKKDIEGRKLARAPLYCQPTVSNVDVFYVDIVAAYPSIYQRMTWGIEYLRNQYFSNDSDRLIYPFPMEWKSGRSYVVTGALPSSVHFVHNHKILVRPTRNPYENPSLVAAVWDVLAAIARFAVDIYHARYFNLDGAVVPESTYIQYCQFLDSLGLNYRTKYSGKSRILNLASWEIGEHKTKRYGTQNLPVRSDGISVTMTEAKWILKRFSRL